MLFVVHAVDKTDMLPTRAKFYRAHRVHLDDAANYDVDVVTAGTLVADDGESPVGSIFVIDAKDRAAVHAFARTDPYCVNSVWDKVQIHGYTEVAKFSFECPKDRPRWGWGGESLAA